MISYFNRNIEHELTKWSQQSDRKPLIIRGARQVGKTVAVRLFSKRFKRFAELNLEKASHAALFKKELNSHELIQAIVLECNVPAMDSPLLSNVKVTPVMKNALIY